jgi:hypothetical protein
VTDDEGPFGVGAGGVGELGDEESPPPQAVANSKIVETNTRRNENTRSSQHETSAALVNSTCGQSCPADARPTQFMKASPAVEYSGMAALAPDGFDHPKN